MKIVASNKRARFDYDILETVEAGLALTGAEVKSVKAGHVSLKGAYAAIGHEGPVILNMHIRHYEPAGKLVGDPTRTRSLLLHKKEVDYLRGKSQEQGLTIVPVSVYIRKNLVKVELGLGRGKKKYDKRETIKKRDHRKEMARLIKHR